jgi:hypothetical protein
MNLQQPWIVVEGSGCNVVKHDPALPLPVRRFMLSIGIFFFAAFVMNPRRECPVKSPATPAAAARRRRNARDIAWVETILRETPRRSNVRNTRPSTPTAPSQPSSAITAPRCLLAAGSLGAVFHLRLIGPPAA